jgi:hypothetical protein
MLQQLHRTRSFTRIPLEALLQKVNARITQLLLGRQLRRIALSNMVHDRPLVVHGCPGPSTSGHFEDNAAERPHIDGAVAACRPAADYFRGHVHGGSGHGALAALTGGVVFGGEGAALAGDEFGGAEVDVFDYTVVVEEDI